MTTEFRDDSGALVAEAGMTAPEEGQESGNAVGWSWAQDSMTLVGPA